MSGVDLFSNARRFFLWSISCQASALDIQMAFIFPPTPAFVFVGKGGGEVLSIFRSTLK